MKNKVTLSYFIAFIMILALDSCFSKELGKDKGKKEENEEKEEKIEKKQVIGKCVNPKGKQVSWYMIFSLNNQHGKYVYIDNTMKKFESFDSKEESFPPIKLVPALNNKSEFNYLVWNDDSISGKETGFSKIAHSKGIFISDKTDSTFLVHSLPRFPTYTENLIFEEKFTSNWGIFTQTWLCVSVNNDVGKTILDNLVHLAPPIQASNILKVNKRAAEDEKKEELSIEELMDEIVNPKRIKRQSITLEFKTKTKGIDFVYFIRPNNIEIPLQYDTLIPYYFKSSIFVGTWTKPDLQPSSCDDELKIINITEYNLLGMRYTNQQDHSKWVVTEKNVAVCIGDLNRTGSQLKRAGGILCIKSELISKLVKQFIYSTEECKDK